MNPQLVSGFLVGGQTLPQCGVNHLTKVPDFPLAVLQALCHVSWPADGREGGSDMQPVCLCELSSYGRAHTNQLAVRVPSEMQEEI